MLRAFHIGTERLEMLRLPYRYRKVSDASRAIAVRYRTVSDASRDRDSEQVGCGDGTERFAMLRVSGTSFAEKKKSLSGGQGRFRISPLRPPNNPLTPLKRVLRRRTPVG